MRPLSEDQRPKQLRLRRAARRQELMLRKNGVRDPRALLYGTYMLVDAETGEWVAWGHDKGYGLTLDEIEQALDACPSVDQPFRKTREVFDKAG